MTAVPLQSRTLDTWSDGSIRWALLDFQATCFADTACVLEIGNEAGESRPVPSSPITIALRKSEAAVETGTTRFVLHEDGRLVSYDARLPTQCIDAAVQVADQAGNPCQLFDGRLTLEERGDLRSVLLLTAALRTPAAPGALDLFVRYHFYAGLPVVRIQMTLRNPHRAEHRNGYWELGDSGSRLLRDVSFVVSLPRSVTTTQCSPDHQAPLSEYHNPFHLYQESSGGEQWNSANHVNREGLVPLRWRGYRIEAGGEEAVGSRATPVVQVRQGSLQAAVAHRHFWQRFPKAIETTDCSLRLGLLPREFPDLHELQGGEQITEDFVVGFGEDAVSDIPLDWVRAPLQARVDPTWYCAAEAIPSLLPADVDPNAEYLALVTAAIDGEHSFVAKRERIDEYGWRNFGDLYADHETVKHAGPGLFISHYNNQYDAIAGFAAHFFRTGDMRWFTLCEDLARHVADVDIYHTTHDKAAYNRGLFWHTNHHVHAGRSTHRTYPIGGGASGGPSSEHNYSTGLMLYHFLTGSVGARQAVLDLARWVIDMDDGEKTPLRWLARTHTGLASQTGSPDYHGPGRGPGNGIVALLNAFRLTGEREYINKTEELIRRCVHPHDDLAALNLLDAERRWYYTVFLQALGRYLDVKAEASEVDDTYAYAQATLLHYSEWMAQHEYPYLDKPEILEYPTETWAAQDMRKSEVFKYAAKHAASDDSRQRFMERAQFFFDYSVRTLSSFPTRTFTRPVVLMLTNGYAHAYFQRYGVPRAPRAAASVDFGVPSRFIPQKQIAKRRLASMAALGAAGLIAAATLLLLR